MDICTTWIWKLAKFVLLQSLLASKSCFYFSTFEWSNANSQVSRSSTSDSYLSALHSRKTTTSNITKIWRTSPTCLPVPRFLLAHIQNPFDLNDAYLYLHWYINPQSDIKLSSSAFSVPGVLLYQNGDVFTVCLFLFCLQRTTSDKRCSFLFPVLEIATMLSAAKLSKKCTPVSGCALWKGCLWRFILSLGNSNLFTCLILSATYLRQQRI